MVKKHLPAIIITAVLTLLPIVAGLILWNRLPDQIATHFNANGEADGYSSKAFAIFGTPLIVFAAHILCTIFTLIDPKRKNIDGKPFGMVLWICPVTSIATSGFLYLYALGYKVNMSILIWLLLGVMFIILGNYLPKCGQNYTVGIKTPWALNDAENWTATHRFGGKVYMITGFAVIALSFLTALWEFSFWIVFAVLMIAACVPAVYSYVYYIKHPKEDE